MMQQQQSLKELNLSVGFIYWIHESNTLRGLKNPHTKIGDYLSKLDELQKQYDKKYPNGLTGWS
jgi:hypothetical protein